MRNLATIDELVLDWNGTVMDDLPRACDATNAVLDRYGLDRLTPDRFRHQFQLPLSCFFIELGIGGRDLGHAEHQWNTHVGRVCAPLMPGARHLLEECRRRHIPVGIVTGADALVVAADAASLRLQPLLTWIAGPTPNKARELGATRANSAGTVAFVGDTAHDIQHARAAGVYAIAYTGGYSPKAALAAAQPDLTIDHLNELTPVLGTSTPRGSVASGDA